MKLSRNITLLFLVPFVATLVALGYRAAQREIGIYESDVSTELELIGRALRPTLVEVWRVEGAARALQLLDVAGRDVSQVKIRWIPRDAMSRVTDTASDRPIIESKPGRNGRIGHVSVVLPVSDARIPAGALALSRSLDREAQLTRDVVRERSLSTVFAVIMAVALGSISGVWFIGKPVRALVLHARRIGEGNLTRVPWFYRSDELGQLADELNAMSVRLADARAHLATEAAARLTALEQLRHADKLSTVGKLAAGLAHELGAPLNVVSARARMIGSGKLAPESIAENATIIGRQTARMTKIIRALLDFARRGHAKKGRTDASEVAKLTVELLAPLSKKRSISLRVEGAESPRIVYADAGQIEQLLTNLVVNAVDASPDAGIVTVQLADEEAPRPMANDGKPDLCLRIDVRDQGMGIPEHDLDRIFEPFFTTKEVGQGTGLGLSVVHGIVHDHGGWIAVQSEPNRGSCFSVYLPKTPA